MKMTKKKVFVAALAVCLVAVLSMGTLAWFSDSDSVTNSFMIADSESDPNEIFSVDVWENTPDGDKDQDGYEYKDILPGDQLKKEVYVENTGAYDQYIRVKVTVNNADAWIAALGNGYDLGTMFLGHDETKWTRYEVGQYSSDAKGSYYTMVFYLNEKLAPNATVNLFETVEIPSQLTQQQMSFVGGQFDLTILAEAVQTENVGDSAYEAFKTVGMN
jgi:predicted ribosomally synthesized peptide with SipW-like signal peptide